MIIVTNFNVAQLRILRSETSEERLSKATAGNSRYVNISGLKRRELDNDYKTITIVTQEVPVEELKETFSKEYIP